MNSVNLIGRLTRDVEIRYTQTQKPVANFSLAVSKGKEDTNFFNCEAWDKTAELLSKYTKKGQQIGITGKLDTDTYEKDGTKITKVKIVVNDLTLLDKKEEEEQGEIFTPSGEDSDLPF